jgi:hypothetical protein
MKTTHAFDAILDAIDWDAPTGLPTEDQTQLPTADANPALYEFITRMAELIPDPRQWQEFTEAFGRYEMATTAWSNPDDRHTLPFRSTGPVLGRLRARSA